MPFFQWVRLNNRANKYGATKNNIVNFYDNMAKFNKTIEGLHNGNPSRPIVNGKIIQREEIAEGQLGDGEHVGIYAILQGEPMEGPEAYAGIE